MGTPPVMLTLVVALFLLPEPDAGPGVDVRDTGVDRDLGLGTPRSETSKPAAEGGGLGGGGVEVLVGGGFVGPLLVAGVEEPDRPDI